jgi:Acyl-protein synthetase, LuxE
MNADLIQITQKVADFISREDEPKKLDSEFDRLALEVFEFQFRTIEPFRRLCLRQKKTPETVQSWTKIPAVPADAFKHFFLFAGSPKHVVRTFKSSGTTEPGSNSQAHFSPEGLNLMRTAIEVNSKRRLFQEGRKMKILALAPNPDLAPHMVMVYGMDFMMNQFGTEECRFLVGPSGPQFDLLLAELNKSCEAGEPVALLGSSFGFVELFDRMESLKLKFSLPEGSRLMDAGGYKGRSREIARNRFIHWAGLLLGLPPQRIVNLLGMTEMASQIYDEVVPNRAKASPHWVRTLVMDPLHRENGDLTEVDETGKKGLLRHLDLANVERPIMIQTDDVATGQRNSFEILERVKGAEPRGCSLTFEEFVSGRNLQNRGKQ